jgi:hypothetical protein
MLLTISDPRFISSALINDGAKVLEVGVPLFELDRFRPVALLGGIVPANEEYDWCRLCGGLWFVDNGDVRSIDFGLPLEFPGLGDGDDVLAKGLLRFCARLDAILEC